MDVNFYKQYVNINFDEILRENNNPLVTSQTVYLNFRKDYLDKTLQAYDSFNKYNSELQSLESVNGYSSDTKHVYVYKNDKRIQQLRQQIKNIVINQERRFNDFYHYITLLNTNREIFETKSLQQSEKRSFFSKLFDKK